jgi:hypothetical protein
VLSGGKPRTPRSRGRGPAAWWRHRRPNTMRSGVSGPLYAKRSADRKKIPKKIRAFHSAEKTGAFRSSSLELDPKTPNASYGSVASSLWFRRVVAMAPSRRRYGSVASSLREQGDRATERALWCGVDERWRKTTMRPRPVDIITRTSHYESFTMIGTGYTLNKTTMRPSPAHAVLACLEEDPACTDSSGAAYIPPAKHAATGGQSVHGMVVVAPQGARCVIIWLNL